MFDNSNRAPEQNKDETRHIKWHHSDSAYPSKSCMGARRNLIQTRAHPAPFLVNIHERSSSPSTPFRHQLNQRLYNRVHRSGVRRNTQFSGPVCGLRREKRTANDQQNVCRLEVGIGGQMTSPAGQSRPLAADQLCLRMNPPMVSRRRSPTVEAQRMNQPPKTGRSLPQPLLQTICICYYCVDTRLFNSTNSASGQHGKHAKKRRHPDTTEMTSCSRMKPD